MNLTSIIGKLRYLAIIARESTEFANYGSISSESCYMNHIIDFRQLLVMNVKALENVNRRSLR